MVVIIVIVVVGGSGYGRRRVGFWVLVVLVDLDLLW